MTVGIATRNLGPYTLERRLAVGGSSEIFLAHLTEGETAPGLSPGERVVVKRPLPHVLEDPALKVSFLQECQLAMACSWRPCDPGDPAAV